jgi:hypothetical protein
MAVDLVYGDFTDKEVGRFIESRKSKSHRSKAGTAIQTQLMPAMQEVVAKNASLTPASIADTFAKYEALRSLVPVLPLLFALKAKPFSLENHFFFEPMFSTLFTKRTTFITGRQVGKSQSVAASLVAKGALKQFFNQLYVTPQFETTRRFSSNYVQSLIEQSPVRRLMIDTSCVRSVLQRGFLNSSIIYFSYALESADRTRGLDTSSVHYDECQDMDPKVASIVQQTATGSDYDLEFYTGTPKTLDTLLESRWSKSSQAQWHIWCEACGFENIPSRAYHLDDMFGPRFLRREISEAAPGVVCANCQKPIFPRTGHWVHHWPQRRFRSPGYHLPQLLLPLHYKKKLKWETLLNKRESDPRVFYNEVCGESLDFGAKLIEKTALIAASQELGQRIPSDPHKQFQLLADLSRDYEHRVISVDWGGGGEDEISRTVVTAMGMKSDGVQDVVFGHRFLSSNDFPDEVRGILKTLREFRATHIVHDFGGQGAVREQLMVDRGFPLQQLVPVSYVGKIASGMMRYIPEKITNNDRGYYQLYKAYSFLQTCELIRRKRIRFFRWDPNVEESEGPGRPDQQLPGAYRTYD